MPPVSIAWPRSPSSCGARRDRARWIARGTAGGGRGGGGRPHTAGGPAPGGGMTLLGRGLKETPKELCWEATRMALDSAKLEMKDVDAVVTGSAPDAFDGVHQKGEYYADGCGGFRKPP